MTKILLFLLLASFSPTSLGQGSRPNWLDRYTACHQTLQISPPGFGFTDVPRFVLAPGVHNDVAGLWIIDSSVGTGKFVELNSGTKTIWEILLRRGGNRYTRLSVNGKQIYLTLKSIDRSPGYEIEVSSTPSPNVSYAPRSSADFLVDELRHAISDKIKSQLNQISAMQFGSPAPAEPKARVLNEYPANEGKLINAEPGSGGRNVEVLPLYVLPGRGPEEHNQEWIKKLEACRIEILNLAEERDGLLKLIDEKIRELKVHSVKPDSSGASAVKEI